MEQDLKDSDYLDLWRYFEDRADNVKEAMFSSVTVVLGFSGAVIGFVIDNLVDARQLTLSNPTAVLCASVVGIAFGVHAVIMVLESRPVVSRSTLVQPARTGECRSCACVRRAAARDTA